MSYQTEYNSSCKIRCPQCRHIEPIDDRYYVYQEGEHSVMCQNCGFEFTIKTVVDFRLISPEIMPIRVYEQF
jgi:transposase-like protein